MSSTEEALDRIEIKLNSIEQRLFHDNGKECLQSKINRHDIWIRKFDSKMKTICITLLGSGGVAGFVFWVAKRLLGG